MSTNRRVRRTRARRLAWLLGAAAAVLPAAWVPGVSAAQQPDFDGAVVAAQPVADGLHMLTGLGGNLALSSGPDGALLVDDQYAPMTEKILAAVRAVTPEPVRFVLNTHWHLDHTGGNENFGRAGSVIVAHENVRRRMSTGQVMKLLQREIPPAPPEALPVVTFTESVTLHWNGQRIDVVHVANAHTDGDAVVWFREADVLHAGDLFFNGFYPFIDAESGGSVEGVIAAAGALLEEAGPATKIIPGHGPLADRAALEAYRAMLVTVRDRVRDALARGQDADALVAEAPLADLEEKWGGGFLGSEPFLRIVYDDLSR